MRIFGFALFLSLLCACTTPDGTGAATTSAPSESTCAPRPSRPDAALQPALDPVIDAALKDGFAGGVVILRDGARVYERYAGTADREGRVPVTSETLFHVASITKYVTAALVFKAVEEGMLSLDQSAAALLGSPPGLPATITIGDLVAHRSGLGSSYVAETIADRDAATAAIGAAAREAKESGAFRYSNDGYDLLGIVLERVYGKPYEALVREKLFRPACLTHFGFWGEADLLDPSHISQPLEPLRAEILHRNYGMLSSAALLISASDLAAWGLALQSDAVLADATRASFHAGRGTISIGDVLAGSFLIAHPQLGAVISARGAEDWGDNAYLNDYRDAGVILAVVTSRGPAEAAGKPRFRDIIAEAVEAALAEQSSPKSSPDTPH